MLRQYSISGASGKTIAIDLLASDDALEKPIIIFAHGFKGFKNWGTHHLVARYFANNGINFLKFNFSHNGISDPDGDAFDDLESFANNTFTKELFDLDQVVSFALSGKHFKKPSKIFLIGHSLGGAISIIYSAENKEIDKLVTWASISSFRNLWSPEQEATWKENGVLYFPNSRTNQQMPIYSTLLEDLIDHPKRLDILLASAKVSQPWLILHGDNDTPVPHHHAEQLKQQLDHAELMLIPGADHVFNAKHPWDEEHLPPALKEACDASMAFFKRP